MGFGDFQVVCSKVALPFCPLVGSSSLSQEAGLQAECYARTIELANTLIFQGAASFVHIIALVTVVIMIFHVRSKFTAVGRKEITQFFYLFLALTVCSLILDAGVVPPGSGALPYFAAVQIGLAAATCLCLMINGFLGFQVYEDGTALSLWVLRGSCTFWFIVTFIVSLLTFQGWAGLGHNNTVGLFVIMYILNGLFLLVWIIMQLVLVTQTLEDRWPLGDLFFCAFFFVIGQVILYTLSPTICETAQHYVDGLFFATVCNLLAVMMVYKYWDSITTEDLEFSVGARLGNWDVKDYMPVQGQEADPYDYSHPRGSAIYGFGGHDQSTASLSQPIVRQSVHDKHY